MGRYFNGIMWGSFYPLGGGLYGGPAATSWALGRLDVFARGTRMEPFGISGRTWTLGLSGSLWEAF